MIGDAYVELGRYREAFAASTDEQAAASLSSYARVSYGRELIGHTAAAIRAMKLAVDAATGAAEPTAWTHVQLGKLYLNHGRSPSPSASTASRLQVFPGYAYGLDALAQVTAAAGNYRRQSRSSAPPSSCDPAAAVCRRARRPLPRHRPPGGWRSASTR